MIYQLFGRSYAKSKILPDTIATDFGLRPLHCCRSGPDFEGVVACFQRKGGDGGWGGQAEKAI